MATKSQTNRHIFSLPEMLLLTVFTVLAFYLGYTGYALYFSNSGITASASELAYWAVNLFVLQYTAKGPIPPELDYARWFAPLVLSYTVVKTILAIMLDKFSAFRLRRLSSHAVIIGLDEETLLLAKSMRARNIKIVVVDNHEHNEHWGELKQLGIFRVSINPADATLLGYLNIAKAKYLYAASASDNDNLDIIRQVKNITRKHELQAVCKISNESLIEALCQRPLFSKNHEKLVTKICNADKAAARWLVSRYGPDVFYPEIKAKDELNIVIISDDQLAISLIFRLAEIGIYGVNTILNVHLLLPPTILDSAPFDQDSPIHKLINVETLRLTESIISAFSISEWIKGADIIYVALQEAGSALLALQQLSDAALQMPVVVTETNNVRAFNWLSTEFNHNVNFHFAKVKQATNTIDTIFGQSQDRLAKAIHEEYVKKQKKRGESRETNNSLVDWDELAEVLKNANRNQADHVFTKCRYTLGHADITAANMKAALSPENIDALAQMEHKRWLAEKWLAGWQYTNGEKDATKRLSPKLIPWSALNEVEKQKDRDAVKQLPALVKLIESLG